VTDEDHQIFPLESRAELCTCLYLWELKVGRTEEVQKAEWHIKCAERTVHSVRFLEFYGY
jgi:hypothetical protein